MNSNRYIGVIEKYIEAIQKYKSIGIEKRYDILKEIYEMSYKECDILKSIEVSDSFKEESEVIKLILVKYLPILEDSINEINDEKKGKKVSNELKIKYHELLKNVYYLVARRSFKHYLLALEFEWKKKVFKPRIKLFEPIIYYLNKMALDNDIELLRISMPPGYAKSVTVTAFSSFLLGIDLQKSILRISSSDLLVEQFARDTQNFLLSKEQGEIFPFFKDSKFVKKTSDEFQLYGSNEMNFRCRTRDSRIVRI